MVSKVQPLGLEFDPTGATGAAKGNLENASLNFMGASSAVVRPAINKLQETRFLTDFVDKSQWSAIRNGTATTVATNSNGVDAFSAALSDISTTIGGTIIIPEGVFLLPQMLSNRSNLTIRGQGASSIVKAINATSDQIRVDAPFNTVADLRMESAVTRTGGACLHILNSGARFHAENVESFGAFRLWWNEGAADPVNDAGVFIGKNLRAYDTVQGGYAYHVAGGYLVHLTDIVQAGDPTQPAINGPAAGIFVQRAADLCVDGNSQILNCQRSLSVEPGAGNTVAAFRMHGGFMGTSHYGSRITTEFGGNVVSTQLTGVWMGENKFGGTGPGLTIKGAAAGRLQQIELSGCEFPLCEGDGLNVDAFAEGVKVVGGWADGCGGAGYAFNGTNGFQLRAVRSGAARFGGNGSGAFVDGTCNNFIADGDFRGNTGPGFNNGAGTGPTKIVTVIT